MTWSSIQGSTSFSSEKEITFGFTDKTAQHVKWKTNKQTALRLIELAEGRLKVEMKKDIGEKENQINTYKNEVAS